MDIDECVDLFTAADIKKINESYTNISGNQNQKSYHEEWERLFGGRYYAEKLKCIGIKGQLRSSRFRSICWRVYLECLPDDPKEWVSRTKSMRNEYERILEKLETNPRLGLEDMDLCLNNPLSQSTQSPWNQYFRDSELKISIQQDVVRTFPEIEFFHSSEIQAMMVNLLFCYARQFPHISYRQGMHELLAPIIFVLHSDQQAYLHASEIDLLDHFDPNTRLDIRILLNPNYTEHDAYFIFCQVMEAVEGWYVINGDLTPKGTSQFSLAPFSRNPDSRPSNALGFKLIKIYEQLLRRHDPELFSHLEQMEIVPQIYGIRWLRLLFGREFAIQDLLVIWDAIFASNLCSDLVDYIFTAMLVFIRDLLLKSDFASCLSHLMRYPAVADVHYVIDLALHLRDPVQYSRPVGYSKQMLKHVPLVGGRRDIHRAPAKNNVGQSTSASSSKLPRQGSVLRFGSVRPKTLAISQAIVNKPLSEPTTLESSPPSEAEQCEEFSVAINKGYYTDWDPLQLYHHRKQIDDNAPSSSGVSADFQKPGCSSSLPRTTIKGIMENDSHGLKASVFSHSLSHLDGERTKRTVIVGREMLPLMPHSGAAGLHTDNETSANTIRRTIFKSKDEEIKYWKSKALELLAMTEYSGRRMTLHLHRLQECMVHQKLQHEDEMLIALAGLKRIRDILKGTVSFTQEVSEDDDHNVDIQVEDSNSSHLAISDLDSRASVERLDSYVFVQDDMCEETTDSIQPKDDVRISEDQCASPKENNEQCHKSDTNSTVVGSSLQAVKKELCKFLLRPEPLLEEQDPNFPSC